jgi:hypothetical protein
MSEEDKIEFLKKYLNPKSDSHSDYMKEELSFYFFEATNNTNFLDSLDSEKEISGKVEFLISKMIMHEHEDGLQSIIDSYV